MDTRDDVVAAKLVLPKRALVAEDNPINAQIASVQLKDIGFEVDVVKDGSMAIDKFSTSEVGYYGLILMDLMMPVMNGMEAAKAIRELDRSDAKTVPIVAVSANSYPEYTKDIEENGVNCFITKPYNKKQIQELAMRLTGNEVV